MPKNDTAPTASIFNKKKKKKKARNIATVVEAPVQEKKKRGRPKATATASAPVKAAKTSKNGAKAVSGNIAEAVVANPPKAVKKGLKLYVKRDNAEATLHTHLTGSSTTMPAAKRHKATAKHAKAFLAAHEAVNAHDAEAGLTPKHYEKYSA
jgi:hypothetical protein